MISIFCLIHNLKYDKLTIWRIFNSLATVIVVFEFSFDVYFHDSKNLINQKIQKSKKQENKIK